MHIIHNNCEVQTKDRRCSIHARLAETSGTSTTDLIKRQHDSTTHIYEITTNIKLCIYQGTMCKYYSSGYPIRYRGVLFVTRSLVLSHVECDNHALPHDLFRVVEELSQRGFHAVVIA